MSVSTDEIDPDVLSEIINRAQRDSLTPITPSEAVEMYLSLIEEDRTAGTINTHRSRLSFFIEWCRDNDIENLNDLDGRDIFAFRQWRADQLDSQASVEANMGTFRLFLRKCVKFDAVLPGLPDKVDVPTVDDAETAREVLVDSSYARQVLDRLSSFHYAQQEHVVWVLITDAGLRISAIYAADVDDYQRLDEGAVLDLRHRPESDTPLKNKQKSERRVYLGEATANVIDDFLAEIRPDVTDDNGRAPLVASKHGRLRKSTMRKYVYKWTRPCVITGECPHGIDQDDFEDCEARDTASDAYQCDSSKSPHAVRRGYITAELDAGVPKAVLSDRCDVSVEVIETAYDERDPDQKMRLRRDLRESAYEESQNGGYADE